MEKIQTMTQEEYNDLRNKATEYVFNIMELGEYTEDKLKKIQEENKNKDLFTNFSDIDININMEHLLRGYGNFGRAYLDKVVASDPASALNMFEAVTQQWLDINQAIQDSMNNLEAKIKNSMSEAISEAEKKNK